MVGSLPCGRVCPRPQDGQHVLGIWLKSVGLSFRLHQLLTGDSTCPFEEHLGGPVQMLLDHPPMVQPNVLPMITISVRLCIASVYVYVLYHCNTPIIYICDRPPLEG
jgi:hypothetical protein